MSSKLLRHSTKLPYSDSRLLLRTICAWRRGVLPYVRARAGDSDSEADSPGSAEELDDVVMDWLGGSKVQALNEAGFQWDRDLVFAECNDGFKGTSDYVCTLCVARSS